MDIFGRHDQINIPITFGRINRGVMNVEQEEWNYLTGNEEKTQFKDCFSWNKLTKLAKNCANICLPVNLQYIWEEKINRPKCQNGSDHQCMMAAFTVAVRIRFNCKYQINLLSKKQQIEEAFLKAKSIYYLGIDSFNFIVYFVKSFL